MWPPENAGMDAPFIQRIADPEQLMAHIIECVEQKDSKGLKTHILEHKLKEESIIWDLILKIGECIKIEVVENHPEFFDVCNRCLLYLAKVGNPKESLLAFLQQMDTFEMDDTKFKNFLKYLELVLQRIPTKLFHSLDITLETISAHIEVLPLPENLQLEGNEIRLFHLDDKVVRLNELLDSYLEFLTPLVASASLSSQDFTDSAANEALVLKKHLITLFNHPLCHLILTIEPNFDRNKSDSRVSAEKAMNLLSKVETDFHRFLKNSRPAYKSQETELNGFSDKDSNKEKANDSVENIVADIVETWDFKLNVSPLAKACISYLIHTEFLGLDKCPSVYTHEYMLEFHLESLSVLLKNTNYAVNFKGLLLCQSLTDRVSENSVGADSLDNPGYLDVLNGLINIMIKCPVRDHRTLATSVFPTFITKFNSSGRYKVYQNILSSCSHSGLKGYLITLLKNDLRQSLQIFKMESEKMENFQVQNSHLSQHRCFCGNSLHRLLKLVLFLPENEETDMLENSDQIISALNILRFLILADPPSSNLTGVWDYMETIEKDFIGPLRLGLDISQAHYKLEKDNIAQGKVTGGKVPEFSVSVEGGVLPTADREQKLDLLGKALNTHELMTSLLCRLTELMEQYKNSAD
ncbi:glomulin-like [Elysia marginata]|uniref:Glomulin-like n=1 Tax=Elysia marginata TaxID=1093978 RepID=A0AAV4GAI6_9GAST|nr:glomulin-like [Elysia marginata]